MIRNWDMYFCIIYHFSQHEIMRQNWVRIGPMRETLDLFWAAGFGTLCNICIFRVIQCYSWKNLNLLSILLPVTWRCRPVRRDVTYVIIYTLNVWDRCNILLIYVYIHIIHIYVHKQIHCVVWINEPLGYDVIYKEDLFIVCSIQWIHDVFWTSSDIFI